MASDHVDPINIGSEEMVTINELVALISAIEDISLQSKHDLTAPQGVRGRSSDNTLVRQVLDWEPTIGLADGLAATYRWIKPLVEQHKQSNE